jgi:hypothetical protein
MVLGLKRLIYGLSTIALVLRIEILLEITRKPFDDRGSGAGNDEVRPETSCLPRGEPEMFRLYLSP